MEKNKKSKIKNISVLGAGSWGITLSILLHEKGFKVKAWEFDKARAKDLKEKHSLKFLPGINIPSDIEITEDIKDIKGSDMIILALPSHTVRKIARDIAGIEFPKDVIILNASKGIEEETLMRMSEVLTEELPTNLHSGIAVLSGPSHAEEVSKKIPTSIVVASKNEKSARTIQEILMTPYFRVYTNADLIGVELGGALKNIIAIACGVSDGLGLGDNTKAALMTRGLAEITRLGVKLGAEALTFAGLSGMGDLIVTCSSHYSRNRNFGEKIGKGVPFDKALSEIGMVVEGIKTTKAARGLAKKHGVSMPITDKAYNVLFKGEDASKAVSDLMLREAKPEIMMEGYR